MHVKLVFVSCFYFSFLTHNDASSLQQDAAAAAKKRSPSDFLKSVLGRPVRVKLNSGTEYRGKNIECACCRLSSDSLADSKASLLPLAGVLACLDGYMNIAMEQTEEFVDGQLKAKYGDCFIRGNNGESCAVFYLVAAKR